MPPSVRPPGWRVNEKWRRWGGTERSLLPCWLTAWLSNLSSDLLALYRGSPQHFKHSAFCVIKDAVIFLCSLFCICSLTFLSYSSRGNSCGWQCFIYLGKKKKFCGICSRRRHICLVGHFRVEYFPPDDAWYTASGHESSLSSSH